MELSLAWRMLLDVMPIAILQLFGHDKAFNEESISVMRAFGAMPRGPIQAAFL